jgi:fermentation-respiration switch protein FrsA (DUF1100 family)
MIWTILAIILILYLGLALLLFLFQHSLIYFPTRAVTATPAAIGLAYDEVRFHAEDGIELAGWFVPAPNAATTLLFFHGNAGNISHRLASIELFHRLGLNVFIFDYRGYGQSQGSPTETGTYRDAAAAWRYLVEDKQIPPGRIIFFGRSLGGSVAAWLAERQPPQALILESTFTSIPDMAARQFPFLPVRLLARARYDTLARIPNITAPVLIIHSPADEIIPYSHSRRLFEAARQPKAFLELTGSHNEGFLLTAQYEANLAAFIAQYAGENAPKNKTPLK